jgi:hypothetical protein
MMTMPTFQRIKLTDSTIPITASVEDGLKRLALGDEVIAGPQDEVHGQVLGANPGIARGPLNERRSACVFRDGNHRLPWHSDRE